MIDDYYELSKRVYYLESKILNNTHSFYNVEEFEPIQKMCENWLSKRDESKYEIKNKYILQKYMETVWVDCGFAKHFVCRFISRHDIVSSSERGKIYKICLRNFLKNKVLDLDSIYKKVLILEKKL